MPKTTLRQPNCRSSLAARRRTQDPMAAYDRLPPELRGWLAQAALPWSAPCWSTGKGEIMTRLHKPALLAPIAANTKTVYDANWTSSTRMINSARKNNIRVARQESVT